MLITEWKKFCNIKKNPYLALVSILFRNKFADVGFFVHKYYTQVKSTEE